MKKILVIIVSVLFSFFCLSCNKKDDRTVDNDNITPLPTQTAENQSPDGAGGDVALPDNENTSDSSISGDSTADNGGDGNSGNDNLPYGLAEASYFSDDVIKIFYPQITGLSNNTIQDNINEQIKTSVMKYTKGFVSSQAGAALEINYTVTWKGERLLSLKFIGYMNEVSAAYPNSFVFTRNFNIETGEEVRLSDMIKVDDSFLQTLRDNGNIKYYYFDENRKLTEDESFTEPDMTKTLKDYAFGNEISIDFGKADEADHTAVSSYFTEDSLGISIETIHAYGNHIEFEIQYKDIPGYIKKDNSLWKDFPEALQEAVINNITPTVEPEQETSDINEEEIRKNTNYVPGFTIIKDQSFWVDLENWGKVYFITASGEGEFGLDSLYMYLADKDSNILYEFPYFYGNGMLFCGTRAVAFKDVNKDGLKDIIVIAGYMTGIGPSGAEEFPVAGIYFQKDKEFVTLPEIDDEINSTLRNETVDMITEYLKDVDISLE